MFSKTICWLDGCGVGYTEKMAANITCKNCGNVIEIAQALADEVTSSIVATERAKFQKQLDEAQKNELGLRKQKLELEEEKRKIDLTLARKLDEERIKIRQKTTEEILEIQRLKDLDKDKVINDLKKSLEDAQRKATQGSQQLQGEVQELDLEQTLKLAFPGDTITPVAKGILGADVCQKVLSPRGNDCGSILWESKRTKAWSDGWATKLKEDLRAARANIPVIVSEVLPEEIKSGLGFYDGIWVCLPKLAIVLAQLLRKSLLDVAREKVISAGVADKAGALYAYVTSHDFVHNVEAMIETYQEMQEQISKERMTMERVWKTREIQVQRLMSGVSGIYGSMQGIVGGSLADLNAHKIDVLE